MGAINKPMIAPTYLLFCCIKFAPMKTVRVM